MFLIKLFTAGIGTLYIIEVSLFAFGTLGAFNVSFLKDYFTLQPVVKRLMYYEFLISTATELSLQLIMTKIIIIQLVKLLGGFNYMLCCFMYYVDICTLLGLVRLFYEMLKEKRIVEEFILSHYKLDVNELQRFINWNLFICLINPLWTPSNITIHPNITYATTEEIRETLNTTDQDYDQPRKHTLNIITATRPTTGHLKPVLIHIHGGAWRAGKKDIFYPYQKILVSEEDWIVVNVGYRLASKSPYPASLIDVKRAIRWVRENIFWFGGNADCIILAGDSAGGHLAAVACLTANDPRYQPGFEDVVTSAQGVISLNGALDITTGARDNIIESYMAANFMTAHKSSEKSQNCKLVEFPAGHHVSYITWSPRSLFTARVIQAWCSELYQKQKGIRIFYSYIYNLHEGHVVDA
ncbi:hypothetical protein RO3G_02534 [Rhizopus delemar RA 99-880]|uniref:BD-FAE-like domain-containing protein n=1 Tax=Rhizopus delemar (strain RA 99-880 / ATCC MYA-4621 / FGSC 9543 / NRRL 43880) TaxID=246409 RepID=I1BNQ0_RHIO9|nr:hypothetical protein RO3G_02534 [Rhizopus delemar RA 99-880]|eukprot:EIE77830.1 hypothetical protein RO3G_02534 [Rhizopus delemar RA 99-880]